MAHIHDVIDTDIHYKIDSISRSITNINETKRTLVQNDHNSERLTFEIPRYIEGHDLTTCNSVQIHYINIDINEKDVNPGVYTVKDVGIKNDDESTVIFTWLISNEATKYKGTINFTIRFACVDDEGNIDYAWNTLTFESIYVSKGICNSEAVAQNCADILIQWQKDFKRDFINKQDINVINGVAGLDEEGKLLPTVIPEGSGGSGGTGVPELFTVETIIEFTDEQTPYTVSSSATWEEINSAYNQGKLIVLKLVVGEFGTFDSVLSSKSNDVFNWFFVIESSWNGLIKCNKNDEWSMTGKESLLAKESMIMSEISDTRAYALQYTDDKTEAITPLIIHLTWDDATVSYAPLKDITYDEIKSAYDNNKIIIVSCYDEDIDETFICTLQKCNNYYEDTFVWVSSFGSDDFGRRVLLDAENTWRVIPFVAATQGYVNTQIGDIETALENIIIKYGLGGDSV